MVSLQMYIFPITEYQMTSWNKGKHNADEEDIWDELQIRKANVFDQKWITDV